MRRAGRSNPGQPPPDVVSSLFANGRYRTQDLGPNRTRFKILGSKRTMPRISRKCAHPGTPVYTLRPLVFHSPYPRSLGPELRTQDATVKEIATNRATGDEYPERRRDSGTRISNAQAIPPPPRNTGTPKKHPERKTVADERTRYGRWSRLTGLPVGRLIVGVDRPGEAAQASPAVADGS